MMPPQATIPPRTPPKRTTGGVTLGQNSSRDAKRTAAAILEVLAGQRTPAQAAEALSVSLPGGPFLVHGRADLQVIDSAAPAPEHSDNDVATFLQIKRAVLS